MRNLGRRHFLAGAAALAVGTTAQAGIGVRSRIIVDNDFAGDPDGIAALVHQLLSPTTRVDLITTSALDRNLAVMAGVKDPDNTAAAGAALAAEAVRRVGETSRPKVEPSGAQAIVAEAHRNDPLPLFLTCGGPLTNVANALKLDPSIASKMTLIWIGGGVAEYNLMTDLDAARYVFERSNIPVWQIPETTYRNLSFAFSELELTAADSPLAQWLYDKLTDVPEFVHLDGARALGDSGLVLLTALSSDAGRYRDIPAKRFLDDGRYGDDVPGRTIRIYDDLDAGLLFRDFTARLSLTRRHA